MIKLERGKKPEILNTSQHVWQQALDLAIIKYGKYSNIPALEKTSLISHYRNDLIKQHLFESSKDKCAFCECKPGEGGNIEVEHFKPKSIYPQLTFEWSNFLPSCRKCNSSKSNHDTGTSPIVNPYDSDPDLFFYYEDIRIKPIADNALAKNTITVCSLNSVRLMRPRGEILSSLHAFAEAIEDAMEEYKNCKTSLQQKKRLRRIAESIELIEKLSYSDEKYSGFCKSYLNSCSIYQAARELVTDDYE
jgi:uncharacterized protein (TIGR02646 family)